MNYIINPMWFYWANVVDAMETTVLVVFAFSFACFIVSLCATFYNFVEKESWSSNEKYYRYFKRIAIITGIISLIFAILLIFIPDKTTLITIMVAKFATYENAELTVDAIKSAVDYIVQSINSIG